MGVKLKTDENLPDSAAALLRAAGHDVTTALAEELGGVADPRVAADGWDDARVRGVLEHSETQAPDEAVAEDEAAYQSTR